MMPSPFKKFLLGAHLLLLLLVIHAESGNQSGFISIDCGLEQKSGYEEKTTKINYVSDETFVDTGENKQILPSEKNDRQQPYWSLRSFPQGTRNCYKINVTSGTKYLIRASFFYGNYDGQHKLPQFELHLGPNLWDLVQIVNQSIVKHKELIHIPLRNYIHVCVVNTGFGVPFISSIELRPLPIETYQTQIGSLVLGGRFDLGQKATNSRGYRYPYDVHDRFWYGFQSSSYSELMTTSSIDDNDQNSYKTPSIVMTTAATPKNAEEPLNAWWEDADNNTEYYVYMHFAEVEKLQPNQSRVQYITRNGQKFGNSFSPRFLYKDVRYNTIAFVGGPIQFSIVKAPNSTLPPILNAIELYKVKRLIRLETNQQDFDAITNIKSIYQIQNNWQGDPCSPLAYLWKGVNCSYPEDNKPPRIISLNLSSSGLTGEIALSMSNLAMIEILDLSNNTLTGPIPEFLSQLQRLKILNLEKNMFTGSVPAGLVERRKYGSLSLSFCENPKLSGTDSCKKEKRSLVIPIVVSLVGVSILVLSLAAATWWCGFKTKKQHDSTKPSFQYGSLESTKREFTYSEILKISNNLERILGKGGFGIVYHGYLDATHQVAIKMLSSASFQGFQQFHAEVNLLKRVHHKNLTSLVGYCNDGVHVGLVYEYMAKGNLQQHLSGSSSNVLTWECRLQIATDAAQG